MTATSTIRVPTATVARLQRLAAEQRMTMGELVAELVRRFDDERFWQKVNAGYERLRSDPKASADFDAEFAAWDCTLLDGLTGGAWRE